MQTKSKQFYKTGTIIKDNETSEVFKVISCTRIGVLDEYNWKLELKEVDNEVETGYNKEDLLKAIESVNMHDKDKFMLTNMVESVIQ